MVYNNIVLYRVCWRMRWNTNFGYSEPCMTKEMAQSWVNNMNEKHFEMIHWIQRGDEPAPQY